MHRKRRTCRQYDFGLWRHSLGQWLESNVSIRTHTKSHWWYALGVPRFVNVENSPIFFIDKINTPILILHNDKDGAVPWYQGIEFFVAMRRLGKAAWLLNYNDEPHWPVKLQNRKDFNIRMQQFFDYYLKGAAKPKWMERGVPAQEKGHFARLGVDEGVRACCETVHRLQSTCSQLF